MPRYYCDYCDTYLTHDSPSVRKQHNSGYKHKANVRIYYQQFEEQQTQSLIDQRIKEHLGQAAALQQVGAVYAAWQRARPPTPMPMPGFLPPVLPRPLPLPPVYGAPPQMAALPLSAPHGVATSGLPPPPAINIPSSDTNGMLSMYQADPRDQ